MPSEEKELLISLADLRLFFRRSSKQLFLMVLLFASGALFFAALRPLLFEAKSTFREKSERGGQLAGSSLSGLLSNLVEGKKAGHAEAMMRSRKLLGGVVRQYGLQAAIHDSGRGEGLFATVWDNLRAEWAFFQRFSGPFQLSDRPSIAVREVVYSGEERLQLHLTFLSDEEYELRDSWQRIVGYGRVGELFDAELVVFRLLVSGGVEGRTFSLDFLPLDLAIDNLEKNVRVKKHLSDPQLLQMRLRFPDRELAAELLNSLMWGYCNYLKEEHERLASGQIAYLELRQGQSAQELKRWLEEYAATFTADAPETGLTTKQMVEFVAQNQQKVMDKLNALDLESRGYAWAEKRGIPFAKSAQVSSERAHDLKRRRDELELAIGSSLSRQQGVIKADANRRLELLRELRDQLVEVESLTKTLEKGAMPLNGVPSVLRKHGHDAVGALYDQLSDSYRQWKEGGEKEPFERSCADFLVYLHHLRRYLFIYEKSVQDQLDYQEGGTSALLGISLNSASDLYIECSKELADVRRKKVQHQRTLERMDGPDFELSSLTLLLNDPISSKVLARASDLSLLLKGESLHMDKERERFQRELNIQKDFVMSHLRQTVELLDLQEQQLLERIDSLQRGMASLIQQELSILDRERSEAIEERLATLDLEKALYEKQRDDLKKQMEVLPHKWVAEMVVESQMEINKRVVEEVARLVENTVISHNLALAQSAPVDLATTPLSPRPPYLLLWALLGGMAGAVGFSFLLLYRAAHGRLSATFDQLRLAGAQVAGHLRKGEREGSIHRLAAFFGRQRDAKRCLLLLPPGDHCDEELASLLAKKGWRPLLIQGGEGEVTRREGFDCIPGGETSLEEWMTSPRFTTFCERVGKSYDWLIFSSHALPLTVVGEQLIEQADCSAVFLRGESMTDLTPLILRSQEGSLTFLLP